jgi:6-phosphofructo-2-kinase/fructose-2,6-biphosphatase 2
MNNEIALTDFLQRIAHYEDQYESMDELSENHYSFMKIYNTGEKILVHKHEGHIQSRIVYYLMNIHITPRTIYLTRVCKIYEKVTSADTAKIKGTKAH